MGNDAWCPPIPLVAVEGGRLCFGSVQLDVMPQKKKKKQDARTEILYLASQASLHQKLAACVSMNWLALVVGPSHCGKRSTLEGLATAVGARLHTLRLTPETDALELLGSYEQVAERALRMTYSLI